MAAKTDLVDRAMKLSADERAELARRLILSLDEDQVDSDADEAWEAEIERRLQSLDEGRSKLIDWRDSVKRARAAIRRNKSK